MTYVPIPAGTQNWDVPLNAALVDQDSRITTNTSSISTVTTTANNAVPKGTLTVNVKDFGAVGDGVANDAGAMQNAINSLGANGGTVYVPPGSYLLNGSGLAITQSGTRLVGAAAESSKILIGPSFAAGQAVSITAANCQVEQLSISGASGTTTTNPIADGILISGVRRTKVDACTFFNVNGWGIKVFSTSATAFTNPLGTQISRVYLNACSGGIWFKGDAAQAWAMNATMTDVQSYQGGVTTGGNANLDCILIEDAWDVLSENIIAWQNAGTGASLHIHGTCAASFINNLDALGPTTGVNVKVDDSANGSPQNTQISGGVIQQGNIGIQVSGGTNNFRLTNTRVFNNQTHGLQVDGTGAGINVYETFFSQNGQGAAGTNYDINWSGAATGLVSNCRFVSPITSIGVAGVQNTINVTAGQAVRFMWSIFAGTGSTSANWFTARPSAASHSSAGVFEFLTDTNFAFTGSGRVSLQPSASGNNVLATNVNGADANDRFRLLGNGNMQIGPGTGARDTTWGRISAAGIGTSDSDIIMSLAGKGLRVKEGSNAKMGTTALVGGAATVANTSVTATSRILLTSNVDGGTPGFLRVDTRVVGTSFHIQSSSGTDTSTVAWMIYEPA